MGARLGRRKGRGGARGSNERIAASITGLDEALDGVTAEPVELAEVMQAVVVQLAKVNLVLHALRSRMAAGVPAAQVDAAEFELEAILDGLGEAELLATEIRRRLDQAIAARGLRHLSVVALDQARPAWKPRRGRPEAT